MDFFIFYFTHTLFLPKKNRQQQQQKKTRNANINTKHALKLIDQIHHRRSSFNIKEQEHNRINIKFFLYKSQIIMWVVLGFFFSLLFCFVLFALIFFSLHEYNVDIIYIIKTGNRKKRIEMK